MITIDKFWKIQIQLSNWIEFNFQIFAKITSQKWLGYNFLLMPDYFVCTWKSVVQLLLSPVHVTTLYRQQLKQRLQQTTNSRCNTWQHCLGNNWSNDPVQHTTNSQCHTWQHRIGNSWSIDCNIPPTVGVTRGILGKLVHKLLAGGKLVDGPTRPTTYGSV